MQSPQVIYEEKGFLAVNKPAGLIVHGQSPSLVDWLLKKYPEVKTVGDDPAKRPGIIHRLDKDTSGVLLVCRTQATFDYFKRQFQIHQIKKKYLALVHGIPEQKNGEINKPIGLKLGTIRRTVHTKHAKMVKEAVTRYRIRQIYRRLPSIYSLLEVEPLTGRTHQIRVHLASIGHPVVGDKLYTPKSIVKGQLSNVAEGRMFLHAESLEFTTSDGRRLKIAADLPIELNEVLSLLEPAG